MKIKLIPCYRAILGVKRVSFDLCCIPRKGNDERVEKMEEMKEAQDNGQQDYSRCVILFSKSKKKSNATPWH